MGGQWSQAWVMAFLHLSAYLQSDPMGWEESRDRNEIHYLKIAMWY